MVVHLWDLLNVVEERPTEWCSPFMEPIECSSGETY